MKENDINLISDNFIIDNNIEQDINDEKLKKSL